MTDILDPVKEVFEMKRPDWDAWFMAMTFLVAMRSPDQETKQGCVLVDWKSKRIMSVGYNGHPRRLDGLPTTRPGKYGCMVHADMNAILNTRDSSVYAVIYLPMPPCENCLMAMVNSPDLEIVRIVYYEERFFPKTVKLLKHMPWIQCDLFSNELAKMAGEMTPESVLLQAARYVHLRTKYSNVLSASSTMTYETDHDKEHEDVDAP